MENVNIQKNNINSYKTAKFTTFGAETAMTNPQASPAAPNMQELKDEFVKAKKSNGLVERFYNFCKNSTGLGLGSKKIEKSIARLESGEASAEEVKSKIADYKVSQENAAQNFGDLASVGATLPGFYFLFNKGKKSKAEFELKAFRFGAEAKITKITKWLVNSKANAAVLLLPAMMLAGGITKWAVLKVNRIGSKEFKVENEKELNKKELKRAKRKITKERHAANFRNFYTGAFNGLLAPITTLTGGIVGVPAYLLATSGIRYFSSKKEEKDKTIGNFGKNLSNNAVTNILFAAAVAVPAVMSARYSGVLSENLNKVIKNLKDVKLKPPADLPSSKTAYYELKDTLLNSDEIKKILDIKPENGDYTNQITELTKENIFAVKFIQISKKGELAKALKEDCPPTRNVAEAQIEVNRLLNSDKYSLSKCVGVGTIAETYLAKGKSGEEVCIKILKKGITAEKIKADQEKFIQLVTKGEPKEKWTKAQEYLVKGIENMGEGLLKEVDFENEAKAADKLRKFTKVADVVKPIEAKPGVYVMERAKGISVQTLFDYYDAEFWLKFNKGLSVQNKETEEEIAKYTEKIAKIKSKSPDFKDFDLTPKDINKLLMKYIDVMAEQFSKIEKNGKTMHGDVHPGNIFINLEALQSGKGKLFTLIDTGNTIDFTKEQSLRFIKLESFIKNGNAKDITNFVLEDAILPSNLSKEKAVENVGKDLHDIFFDNKTKLDSMNIDTLFALTNNVLRKYDIVPNETQIHIIKAKTSASESFEALINSFFEQKYDSDKLRKASKAEQAGVVASVVKDAALIFAKYKNAYAIQEYKNLFQMSPDEAAKILRNKNMIPTNGIDHLTYKMKQGISTNVDHFDLAEDVK